MKYKLGDICEIVSGITPKTSVEEYWDGDIKWITPAELTDDSYIIDDTARKLTELGVKKTGLTPFPAGTVILSSRAPIGKVAIAGCEMYCNQGFKNLICSDKINNKYLYWFLKGNTAFLNSLGRGATFKEISKGIVGNIEINVPDVADQEKAVVNLEKLSEIIKLRKSELEELDNLIKARFVELFGNLKENDKNWDTYSFERCFEIDSSKRILKSEWKDNGIPFLRVRDMVQLATTGVMDNEFFVSEEFYSSLSDSDGIPKAGDILMSATSTLGKCHIVKPGERFYFKDADVLRFRSKKKINPIFFVNQMSTNYIEDQIAKTLGVTTVAHFTIKAAKTINLRLPDMQIQDEFAEFVKQVDKSKVAVQKSLDEMQLLFNSLTQEYFG